MDFIADLIMGGWLKTPAIIQAFRKIKREDFLPDEVKDMAGINEALPIGYSQTISQPLTVAFMLEKLQPKAGDNILDVGSGSGWTTALLAEIVKKTGMVTGVEIVPGLKEFGEKNIFKYNSDRVAKIILADGSKGYLENAPYDKILASASARELPNAWKEQLKEGGRIVASVGNSIWLLFKNPPRAGKNEFEKFEYPGFAFVPLIQNNEK
jgi:protein-L-isoaspartate(D-aspartate) O-methyltransferase